MWLALAIAVVVCANTMEEPVSKEEITIVADDYDLAYFPDGFKEWRIAVTEAQCEHFYVYAYVTKGTVCLRMWWSKEQDPITLRAPFIDLACGTSYFHIHGHGVPAFPPDPDGTRSVVVQATAEALDNKLSVGWSTREPFPVENDAHLDHMWWKYSYQYVFLDRLLLVVMIVTAILFELLHTFVHNMLKSKGSSNLDMKLWARVNSEFMVLGFIAFALWLVERCGGLEAIVQKIVPHSASDLLHVIEDVHMRLFMCMLLYFLVMAWVVYMSVSYMRTWASTQEDIVLGTLKNNYSRRARQFIAMEKKFKDHLLQHPPIDSTTGRPLEASRIERLNFAAYLTKTLNTVLMELVSIKIPTWLGSALLASAVGLIVEFGKGGDNDNVVFWVMIGAQLIMLVIISGFAIFTEWSYVVAVRPQVWGRACCRSSKTEVFSSRLLQICIFYSCYTMLYFLTGVDARHYFLHHMKQAVPIFLLLYCIPFFLLTLVIVPLILPRFNVVFRTPPHLDDVELVEIVRIAHGKFHTEFFPRLFPERQAKRDHKRRKKGIHAKGHGSKASQGWHAVRAAFESSSEEFSADSEEENGQHGRGHASGSHGGQTPHEDEDRIHAWGHGSTAAHGTPTHGVEMDNSPLRSIPSKFPKRVHPA